MAFWNKIGRTLGDWVDDLAAPEELLADLRAGVAALQGDDPAAAEEPLARVVAADASHSRARHLLGLSLLRQGKLDQAISCLEQASRQRSSDLAVWADLAQAHRADQSPDAALQAFRQALRCRADDEDLAGVYQAMGEIHLARGAHEHAVRELRKAVALDHGQDLGLLGLLGQAQVHAGQPRELAQTSLSRAAAAPVPDRQVLLLLARLQLDQDQGSEALLAARRLLELSDTDAEARALLARCLLAAGDAEGARAELMRAMQHAPESPELYQLLGLVHRRSGDSQGAQTHLETALRLALALDPPDEAQQVDLLRQLLQLELIQQPASVSLEAHARQLLAARPDDPLGLACLGLARVAQPEEAMQLLTRSLAAGETAAARLGLGLLYLSTDRPGQAAVSLRAASRLAPGNQRARSLLEQANRRQADLGPQLTGADIYPLLRRLQRLLESHPALAGLGPEVARVQEVFDRPLLITVMGEFNSGKSTLVNALIGEKIAPMGIKPTTATINILKYGQQRQARVIWRDDREQLMGWQEVGPFLTALDDGQARAIRQVELLYPAEELLRVNVVDTPGLNSLIDEHEQTAREILARADAVIWLFSAQQAGKQTEQQALEVLRQHRLKTVGVLNKIDRLTAEELQQVLEHLQQGFSELVDAVVPVSARQALDAMEQRSDQALAHSRFPELRAYLEQRVFARSRQIKRQASQQRLEQVLAQASGVVGAQLEQADSARQQLDQLRRQLKEQLDPELLQLEQEQLQRGLEQVYSQGAAEVLDFVRPRRWRLGEHQASEADRDFLLDLLLQGLRQLSEASRQRMARCLSSAGEALTTGLQAALVGAALAPVQQQAAADQLVQERLALLQQQVYTRYQAFARGYLLGGRVDNFFAHKLPRLELTAEAIEGALAADAVDLKAELMTPLGAWLASATSALDQLLSRLEAEVELVSLELNERYLGPLLAVDRQLSSPSPDS